jgi:hypothetical protein
MHIRAPFRALLICLLLVLGAPVATTSVLEPTPTFTLEVMPTS